jgi:hypothetical protein
MFLSAQELKREAKEEVVQNCLAFLDKFFDQVQVPVEGGGFK